MLDAQSPSWPVRESRFYIPHLKEGICILWSLLVVSIGATAGGCLLTPNMYEKYGSVLAAHQAQASWPVIILSIGIFGAIVCSLGLLNLRKAWHNRPLLRHAPENYAPQVPIEPVDRRQSTVHQFVPYRTETVADNFSVLVDPYQAGKDQRFIRWFGFGFSCFFVLVLQFTYDPLNIAPIWLERTILAIGPLFCLWSALVLISQIIRMNSSTLTEIELIDQTVHINTSSFARQTSQSLTRDWFLLLLGLKVIDRWQQEVISDQRLDIPLANVVGLQLCPCIHQLGTQHGNKTKKASLELNIVWKSADGRGQRTCFIQASNELAKLASIGQQLADACQAPLLYHATKDHWHLERRRARKRQPHTSGSH